ncbi:Arabinanase/levansucrase/invertase [Eremomyces bilateralis CBS 781.70]|uniref:Arabinanase/levansucrase/invertase n=1 Tax=Eremomyces bilateralis CBS 781.70 TaxID=1392243 RepID=A0A6G1FUZ4_9PEZI|nr:Arabinanase/levansucrase/invertase [Eremomyces bilateralis CBS 781.70]KAF1809528.1 Arabinanase/levansucrase/invertase [Eremomyces bilateralis CBS 781.70]
MSYNNSVLTITTSAVPDPYVVQAHGKFYLVYTAGDRVEIWCGSNLCCLEGTCHKTVVWRPPPDKEYSGGIWAPELHIVDGRWYIYVSCENPREGNKSHRMYVIGGPRSSEDPCTGGSWEFLGPLRGMPNQWAIDGTVARINNQNYFIYSGWPLHNPSQSDNVQCLFIQRMTSPTETVGEPACICEPHEHWEKSDGKGINEGPQWFASPDGSWQGLAYSCAGSWTRDYKMNTLRYTGGDPLNKSSWHKSPQPLIQARRHPPFGPGHGSFLRHDNGETLSVYHGTDRETDGWENRKARLQRVAWTSEGPSMGTGIVGTLVNDEGMFWTMPAAKDERFRDGVDDAVFDMKDKVDGFKNDVTGHLGSLKDKFRKF